MTPEQLQKVGEILEQALDREGAQRARLLDKACAGDAELRREVESLLVSHEQAGSSFLSSGSTGRVAGRSQAPIEAGCKIGPYLLQSEIGRGGMGEVYAAVRADGQYEQRVAIKLVRNNLQSSEVIERFRMERQILAGLDHPNIARLLDGGSTEEGVPYLVMELVEGIPIDAYCDAKKLTITARLNLFRRVCAAVQYAHQRLVIHRDIKPSNILVTQDGVAKLLDFGIAKLVDPSSSAEATTLRPMTPEYASPEQVRGEAITTTSDVYSLGVVLYWLVTGHSPYRVTTHTPAELSRAIAEGEPINPSTAVSQTLQISREGQAVEQTPELVSEVREGTPLRLQRRLRGDIDFIVLKALRKEPEQRYASAEQFAEDIRRHLEGLPVAARKGTWTYKAGKFIKRHKAAVASAALVMIAIAAGVAATLGEARIAQRRFEDVRKLANSLMFEVHDSIENIPGATQARKLILLRSLEYVDKLTTDSGNDPALLRELATAYRRIGMIQGNPRDPNLGDTKGALVSFQKSLQLRESLVRKNPKNTKDQVQLAIAYLDYSDFQSGYAGNVAAGFEYSKKAQAIIDPLAVVSPKDVLILTTCFRTQTNLAMMEIGEGSAGRIGTTADAIADLQKALVYAHQVIPLSPNDLSLPGQEAITNGLLGETYLSLGDRAQAITYYRNARDSLSEIGKKQNNVRISDNVGILEGKIGNALLMDGKSAEVIPYFTRAQENAVRLAALDPANNRLNDTKINSTGDFGYALSESGRVSEGIQQLRSAIQQSEAVSTQTPIVRSARGIFHLWLGQALERQGKTRAASQEYLTSKNLLAAVRAEGADDAQTKVYFCSAAARLASSFLQVGETEKAGSELNQNLAILEKLLQANEDDQDIRYALAESYTGEGMVSIKRAESARAPQDKLSQWQAALAWFQKSLGVWSKIKNPARLSSGGMEMTLPEDVSRRLKRCSAEVDSLNAAARR